MRLKIIVGVLLLTTAFGIFILSNPLRRDELSIETGLAHITPLGISFEEAAAKTQEHYSRIEKNTNSGFLRQDSSGQRTIGVKSFRVHLGDYHHFPIGTTSVDAFWGFDDRGRLMEIWVWKTTDSL